MKRIPKDVIAKILARVEKGEDPKAVAKEFKVTKGSIDRWRKNGHGDNPVSKATGRLEGWMKGERAWLLQVIGEQQVEIMRLRAGRK